MNAITDTTSIDLNADLGEECGDDNALLDIVTSANIACGGHAGNLTVLAETLQACHERGVTPGAHISYPDRAGFGRNSMADTIKPEKLILFLRSQIEAFAILNTGRVPYIKPHGALYHDLAHHPKMTNILRVATIRNPIVLTDPTSRLHTAEYPGTLNPTYDTRVEVFADRAYNPDGTLVSRDTDGAVIHDPLAIAARSVKMATEHAVVAIDGTVLTFDRVDSICLHGDTPGAVEAAQAVRETLTAADITIAPFVNAR